MIQIRLWILITFCLIIATFRAIGQNIIAGDSISTSTWIHYEDIPNVSLFATPWNTYPPPIELDINGDNNLDLKVHVFRSSSSGSGWGRVWLETLNNSQVSVDTFTNCIGNIIPNARKYSPNDTIDASANWLNSPSVWFVVDTSVHLTYEYYITGGAGCLGPFNFYDTAAYLGIRIPVPNDTLYGWIHCRTLSRQNTIIYSYACNLNQPLEISDLKDKDNAFKIYPNPSSDELTIESNLLLSEMKTKYLYKIYTTFGSLIYQDYLTSRKNSITISNINAGIYFLEIDSHRYKFIKLDP